MSDKPVPVGRSVVSSAANVEKAVDRVLAGVSPNHGFVELEFTALGDKSVSIVGGHRIDKKKWDLDLAGVAGWSESKGVNVAVKVKASW